MNILDHIEVVPNFPKEGINFYDVQSLLAKPDIWQTLVEGVATVINEHKPDVILGIESRGFLVGVPVALALKKPFGMIRKKGKLPGDVIGQDYTLEYGTDTIEIQKGIINPGKKVVIVDDLLATGGTMRAAGDLVRKCGGEIMLSLCLLDLYELGGKEKLDFPFQALVEAPLDPFKDAA